MYIMEAKARSSAERKYLEITNHDKLSREDRSAFDIVSNYFANIFYNVLYADTKNMQARDSSKSEAYIYVSWLDSYIKTLMNPQPMKKTLEDITKYFQIKTPEMTLPKFIALVAKWFVPVEYLSHLSDSERYRLVVDLFMSALTSIVKELSAKYLPVILESHSDAGMLRVKEYIFDVLLVQRFLKYENFLRKSRRDSDDSYPSALGSVRDELRRVSAENKQLTTKCNQLQDACRVLIAQNRKLQELLNAKAPPSASASSASVPSASAPPHIPPSLPHVADPTGKAEQKKPQDRPPAASRSDERKRVDHVESPVQRSAPDKSRHPDAGPQDSKKSSSSTSATRHAPVSEPAKKPSPPPDPPTRAESVDPRQRGDSSARVGSAESRQRNEHQSDDLDDEQVADERDDELVDNIEEDMGELQLSNID